MDSIADITPWQEDAGENPDMGTPPLNLMCSLYYESSFDGDFGTLPHLEMP